MSECIVCKTSTGNLIEICDLSHKCHQDCYLAFEIIRCPKQRECGCVIIYEIDQEIRDHKKAKGTQHESDQYDMSVDLGFLASCSDFDDIYYRVDKGEVPDKDSIIQSICINNTELTLYLIERCPELDEECLGYAYTCKMNDAVDALIAKGFCLNTYTLYLLIRDIHTIFPKYITQAQKMFKHLIELGIAPDTYCLNNALERLYRIEEEIKELGEGVSLMSKALNGKNLKKELDFWKSIVIVCIDRGAIPNDESNPLEKRDIDFDTEHSTTGFLELIKDKEVLDLLKNKTFNQTVEKLNHLLEIITTLQPTPERLTQWGKNIDFVFKSVPHTRINLFNLHRVQSMLNK